MTEQANIKNNIKGEKPSKGYEIIQVRNIENSVEVLNNFKNAMLKILDNLNLNDEDSQWSKLLPPGIVNKLEQLDSENLKKDEFLQSINSSIDNFLDEDIKTWKWYSSLELENGFDIVVKGDFNPGQFINFIHCQNVPLANIKIINADKNEEYELKTFKDYTIYKTL